MKITQKSFEFTSKMVVAVLIALFSFANLFAQSDSATLRGTVVDQTGAIIAGAKVTVSNDAKAFKRDVLTNEDGDFTFPQLPPETYKVTVEQKGFGIAEVVDIKLYSADQRQLRVELKPGDVTAAVKIETSNQGVETGGTSSTTVSGQLVERLPLNGRSFQSLLYQVPGVVPAQGDGQISVNGNRSDANYFTLDGVSANIGVNAKAAGVFQGPYGVEGAADQKGAGSIPGFNASGSTANLISIDALQEFKIQTSVYSAEFGRQPGGQVQMTSKSGSNDYHFTGFEYFRNEALDANDWFSNKNSLGRSRVRQHDFGGTLSGPLYLPRFGEGGPVLYNGKNRTFFFASFEALRLTQPLPSFTQNVPAQFVRNNSAVFNPTIQGLLNSFPLPNGPIICSTANPNYPLSMTGIPACPTTATGAAQFAQPRQLFVKNNYTLQDTTAFSLRIDHKINEKWNTFGRFNFAPSNSQAPFVGRVNLTEINTTTATFGLIGILSSNLVNDLRANWSYNTGNLVTNRSFEDGANPPLLSSLLPNIAPAASLVFLTLPGSVSYTLGTSLANRQKQLNLVDGLTWTTGSHTLKFGADWRRLNPDYAPKEYSLNVTMSTMTNLVNGLATGSVAAFDQVPLRIDNYSFYAQDTWRTTRRLTLDYGVRWEINPAPVGTDPAKPLYTLTGLGDLSLLGRLGGPPATTQLTTGKLYPTKYDAIAPRFGIAYNLREKTGWETVLRGGIGIYYDTGIGISTNAASQFPYTRTRSITTATPYPFSDLVGAPATPLSVVAPIASFQTFTVVDPGFTLPRSYQWTLTAEQNLWNNYHLSLSYVGNQGRRLLRRYTTTLSTSAALNPNFTGAQLNITSNALGISDQSDYHAMQVQFSRRFANQWQFLSNYTWSHAIDTGSDDTTSSYYATGQNPQIDRGNSANDRRHVFNASVSYESKFNFDSGLARAFLNGWTIDFVFKAQSAAPFSVTYTKAIPALGTGGNSTFPLRVDLVTGQNPWIIDQTVAGGKRLNPAAFTVGSDLVGSTASLNNIRQGTSPRNGFYGFGATQLDLAVGRQFNLTEKLKLTLRGEMYNLFNHPNFASPNTAYGDFVSGFNFINDSCLSNTTLKCTTWGISGQMLNRSFSSATGAFSPLNQLGGPRSTQLSAKLTF